MKKLLLINKVFCSRMNNDNLLEKVKEAGFKSLDDFVKANLHYLSEEKQKLFYRVIDIGKEFYQEKYSKKLYYHEINYNAQHL
jgi:hypothetical protein